jgi:opacity protein-like surface antigen
MRLLLGLMLLFSFSAMALEVDEKLTVRLLRTSETRKTVMINRGTEDGLVEGDHAKFIVTAGIVARGVCVKVSPTRSVWSIYRLVNADFIVNDSVMTIKMTPAVKITKDESQSLVQEDTPTKVSVTDPTQLGIPLADGAQDINPETADGVSKADLDALEKDEPTIIPEKNVEVFGILNIAGLTANTKTDSGADSFNNSQSSMHFGLGGELYPQKEREWYSHFSLQGMVNLMRQDSQSYNGAGVTNNLTEFALGVNWHPTKLPSTVMDFIPYLHAELGMGSVKSTYKPGTENSGGNEFDANGSTQSFAVGFGYKFFTARGFSARAILDYYMRTEKYKEDTALNSMNKKVGGPRFMIGLGYRF